MKEYEKQAKVKGVHRMTEAIVDVHWVGQAGTNTTPVAWSWSQPLVAEPWVPTFSFERAIISIARDLSKSVRVGLTFVVESEQLQDWPACWLVEHVENQL
jgi:hypothetical protein